jgi:hypothetical protein
MRLETWRIKLFGQNSNRFEKEVALLFGRDEPVNERYRFWHAM